VPKGGSVGKVAVLRRKEVLPFPREHTLSLSLLSTVQRVRRSCNWHFSKLEVFGLGDAAKCLPLNLSMVGELLPPE